MTDTPQSPAEPIEMPGALHRAVALHRAGRFARALRLYERLLDAFPDNAEVLHMRGMMELERGGPELAVPWLERAADLTPSDARVQINLGLAYELCARLEDARFAYERAAQFAPNLARPRVSLAGVWTHLSRDDEAERILREVLSREPGEPQACVITSEILARRGEHERAEKALQTALSRPGLEPRHKGAVLMALGRLLDKVGRYDDAFGAFAEGNRLRAVPYDPARHEQSAERIVQIWTRERIEQLARHGSASEQPVFIVGMPRSGTSLTEQIVAMHSGVFAAGERTHMREVQLEIPQHIGVETPYPACMLEPACERGWGTVARATETLYREMAPDAVRITDKLPSNFLRLGLIAAAFPAARLVHCVRDPRDTALSCFMQDFFAQGVPFANDLTHIGRYYRVYRRLMTHWERVLPGRILDLEYERLVAEPEAQTTRLMAHVGIPWEERCLEFHRSERFVPTASVQQVRKPMYTSSVARWKRYEKHLGPLFEAMGELPDQ